MSCSFFLVTLSQVAFSSHVFYNVISFSGSFSSYNHLIYVHPKEATNPALPQPYISCTLPLLPIALNKHLIIIFTMFLFQLFSSINCQLLPHHWDCSLLSRFLMFFLMLNQWTNLNSIIKPSVSLIFFSTPNFFKLDHANQIPWVPWHFTFHMVPLAMNA